MRIGLRIEALREIALCYSLLCYLGIKYGRLRFHGFDPAVLLYFHSEIIPSLY